MGNIPNFIQQKTSKYQGELKDLKSRKGKFLSPQMARKLSRIHRMVVKEDYPKAISTLETLKGKYYDQPNSLANILEQLGFVYAQTGKYKKAYQQFDRALKLNSLSYNQSLYAMYTMGQLQLALEDYGSAKQILDRWIAFINPENVSAQAWMIMATVYAQSNDKKQALVFVEEALKGKEKKESWLQLAVSLSFELKQWDKTETYLKYLTSVRPEKKNYWKQWWGMYLNQYKDKMALTVMDMAEKQGHIIEVDEYRQLVQMYMYLNQPIKAAKTMEKLKKVGKWDFTKKGKDIQLMAQAYHQARLPMETAKILKKHGHKIAQGKGWKQLALIYFEQFRWDNALKYFEKAIKAGVDQSDKEVLFYAGQAAFESKRFQKALDLFSSYQKSEGDKNQVSFWATESKKNLSSTQVL
jgi:tetratricopeptide (TPR) repeat protein